MGNFANILEAFRDTGTHHRENPSHRNLALPNPNHAYTGQKTWLLIVAMDLILILSRDFQYPRKWMETRLWLFSTFVLRTLKDQFTQIVKASESATLNTVLG